MWTRTSSAASSCATAIACWTARCGGSCSHCGTAWWTCRCRPRMPVGRCTGVTHRALSERETIMSSTETQLRASEIKDVLLREIEQYRDELKVEEVGEVLEVKDGVARIYGLTSAMASEMLEITSSETGEPLIALALNLEEDNIGSVVM